MTERRSSDLKKTFFGETYMEEDQFLTKSKLQNGVHIIGRMLSLCKTVPGRKNMSKEDASCVVADELRDDWITKNVYPAEKRSVSRSILRDYSIFRDFRKAENRPDRKKTLSWLEKAGQFNNRMRNHAYDIRSKSNEYDMQLAKEYGVQMLMEDQAFWYDNCYGDYVATSTNIIPRNWLKNKKRVADREEAMNIKRSKMNEAVSVTSSGDSSKIIFTDDDVDIDNDNDNDSEYEHDMSSSDLKNTCEKPHVTRSVEEPQTQFPSIHIRSGHKTIHEPLMRCLVHCISKYKVTTNDLMGITVSIANTIFDQNWELTGACTSDTEDPNDCESDSSDDETDDPKTKRASRDLTFVMPSRKCLANYVRDASFLNLEMVAQHLLNKGDNVITVGLDDTTKAAGHRLFDVKTDNITIAQTSGEKRLLTTGYLENASHAGKVGAEAYNFKLQCLAILAGSSVDEIKSNIDFWMTDRAADCSKMLADLGVEPAKILKCCAHLLLCIDHSIDKTFRETEQKIGFDKLINASKILHSNSSSLHTLGLIALAKLVSPSHAAHSVSLYNQFKEWLANNRLDSASFKGFQSNRFGRILEIGNEYLKHRDSLNAFFEAVVDENANKLVLAVHTFISNPWFMCCSEIYSLIGEILIHPLMELLGIDGRGPGKQSWTDVKIFFDQKIPQLQKLQDQFSRTVTGKGRLIGAALTEIVESLKRQLSEMDFFQIQPAESVTVNLEKLQLAPLHNLACESRFAKLDNQVAASGGMTTVKTHSDKSIISTNGLLVNQEFTSLDETEKRLRWKWGRTSQPVIDVKQMEKDFLATVKMAKRLALLKKEEFKRKRNEKMLKVLELCKTHGGPVTPTTIKRLDRLSESQLITEICYIRLTICPDIRQKRRIKLPNGHFKFQTFSKAELKQSIITVIQPGNNVVDDIDELVKDALKFH